MRLELFLSEMIFQFERPDLLDLFLVLNLYAAVIRFRLQALLIYRDHTSANKNYFTVTHVSATDSSIFYITVKPISRK